MCVSYVANSTLSWQFSKIHARLTTVHVKMEEFAIPLEMPFRVAVLTTTLASLVKVSMLICISKLLLH